MSHIIIANLSHECFDGYYTNLEYLLLRYLLDLGTDDRGDGAVAALGLEDVDDALVGLPGGAALSGGVKAGLDGLPDLLLGVHHLLWLLFCNGLGDERKGGEEIVRVVLQ